MCHSCEVLSPPSPLPCKWERVPLTGAQNTPCPQRFEKWMVLDEKMSGEKAKVGRKSAECQVALRWQRGEEKMGLESKDQKADFNRGGISYKNKSNQTI